MRSGAGPQRLAPGTTDEAAVDGRLVLRPPIALYVAISLFVLLTLCAVHLCLAQRLDGRPAWPLICATASLLALGVWAWERHRPVAIKVGPDDLAFWRRTGRAPERGRVVACSQWSAGLLVLLVSHGGRRPTALLLTLDMTGAALFRQLAVLGRRSARSGL